MSLSHALSHVRLFATPWTTQSMEFSRSEHSKSAWVAFPFSSRSSRPRNWIIIIIHHKWSSLSLLSFLNFSMKVYRKHDILIINWHNPMCSCFFLRNYWIALNMEVGLAQKTKGRLVSELPCIPSWLEPYSSQCLAIWPWSFPFPTSSSFTHQPTSSSSPWRPLISCWDSPSCHTVW